jgi:hypothetical protein
MLLGHWRDVFRPVGGSLSGPLLEFYYGRCKRGERSVAEGFLQDFSRAFPSVLRRRPSLARRVSV